MTEEALPQIVAPPLAPDATFDAAVAHAHAVEQLDAPAAGRSN